MASRSEFPHLLEIDPEDGDVTRPTLELLATAVPEQIDELECLFRAGVEVRYSIGRSPSFCAMGNVLCLSEEALRQIWLLTHAAWHDFSNFEALKAGRQLAAPERLIQDAVAAAIDIANGGSPAWPPSIPQFKAVPLDQETSAVREMFAMATAWAILHEMRHAKFYAQGDRPDDGVHEEWLCDSYAFDMLFSKTKEYPRAEAEGLDRVRSKRAISALVGLYFIARLSRSDRASESHPPVQDRIRLLFDKVGDEPAQYFWGLATALMWGLRPEIASIKIGETVPTGRDLAYIALSHAFV